MCGYNSIRIPQRVRSVLILEYTVTIWEIRPEATHALNQSGWRDSGIGPVKTTNLDGEPGEHKTDRGGAISRRLLPTRRLQGKNAKGQAIASMHLCSIEKYSKNDVLQLELD
jgi:hypothetical protein